jgi:transcriptional regulator with XRE-family HTH domain
MKFNYIKDIEFAKKILSLSNEDACKMLGITRMTYYRWISHKTTPSLENLEKMYDAFYSKNLRINLLKEEMYKSKESKKIKILYHGAKEFIDGEITIEKSEPKKDFDKGFYVGESLLQSASFVSNFQNSSVYAIECNLASISKIVELDVSCEWMVLISYFRGKIDEYSNSKYLRDLIKKVESADLIIAPIADNTMYDILDDFSSGEITDLQCLNALSANWLGKQYVFMNDKVIKRSLKIIDRFYLCNQEKNDYKTKKEESTKIGKDKVKLAKREYAGKGKYIEDLLK